MGALATTFKLGTHPDLACGDRTAQKTSFLNILPADRRNFDTCDDAGDFAAVSGGHGGLVAASAGKTAAIAIFCRPLRIRLQNSFACHVSAFICMPAPPICGHVAPPSRLQSHFLHRSSGYPEKAAPRCGMSEVETRQNSANRGSVVHRSHAPSWIHRCPQTTPQPRPSHRASAMAGYALTRNAPDWCL